MRTTERCFNGADPLWVGMVPLRMSWLFMRFSFNGADPLWVGMVTLLTIATWA